MTHTEEQIKKAFDDLREVKLTIEEKQQTKLNVVSFMKNNPLEEVVSEDNQIVVSASESSWFVFLTRPIAMMFLMVALGFGGVLMAAEGALPDNSLYAIKTKVNEPIRGAFAVSSESKALWQQELAEKRLGEAIALSTATKITPEQQIKLIHDFQKHIERSKEYASRAVVDAGVQTTHPVVAPKTPIEEIESVPEILPILPLRNTVLLRD